eukprot:GHVQ01032157.1.p1 GENE.GHVQ01032157.1~~GHVQ01032157.1.p1  ORF type:complete len:167 (-),score=5.30 GHVQ01032157.1:182-682(-)
MSPRRRLIGLLVALLLLVGLCYTSFVEASALEACTDTSCHLMDGTSQDASDILRCVSVNNRRVTTDEPPKLRANWLFRLIEFSPKSRTVGGLVAMVVVLNVVLNKTTFFSNKNFIAARRVMIMIMMAFAAWSEKSSPFMFSMFKGGTLGLLAGFLFLLRTEVKVAD